MILRHSSPVHKLLSPFLKKVAFFCKLFIIIMLGQERALFLSSSGTSLKTRFAV